MTLTLFSGALLVVDRADIVALTHTMGVGDAKVYVRGLPQAFEVSAHQPGVTALYKDLTHGEDLPEGW